MGKDQVVLPISTTTSKNAAKKSSSSESILSSCIKASQTERLNILKAANGALWRKQFTEFELEFTQLAQLTKTDPALAEKIRTFLDKYEDQLAIDSHNLIGLYEENNEFIIEVILCHAFNKYKNDFELIQFIKNKKEEIISNFAPKELKKLPADVFNVQIAYTEGETHNGGQVPARVIFYMEGEEKFSVMYKPRSAMIDARVQELLKQLEESSIKIISCPDVNKSIWEYIDGEDMILSEAEQLHLIKTKQSQESTESVFSPEEFIECRFQEGEQKSSLKNKLSHLNDIFLCIHASDLHGKNMRLTPDGNIYAIDLEVIDHRQSTLLMKDDVEDLESERANALKRLNEKIKTNNVENCIKKFKDDIGTHPKKFTLPIRHILLDTDVFRKWMQDVSEPEKVAEQINQAILKAIKERGFSVKNTEKIKQLIYKDILNKDIPFFTEINGNLYYGEVNSGVVIGMKLSSIPKPKNKAITKNE